MEEVLSTIVSTTYSYFNVLKANPLLLLRSHIDQLGYPMDWYFVEDKISICSLSKSDKCKLEKIFKALIIIDDLKPLEGIPSNDNAFIQYEMKFHIASGYKDNDWNVIIEDCLKRENRDNNGYDVAYLLFQLDKDWSVDALLGALKCYPNVTISYIIEKIRTISRILSLANQRKVQSLFVKLGRNYIIHEPDIVYRAVDKMIPYGDSRYTKIIKKEQLNTISLINHIFYIYEYNNHPIISDDPENPFIHLLSWMDNANVTFGNYNMLVDMFPYLSVTTQLKVIKRYFHDIRNGYTRFSPQLMEQLKSNRYGAVSVYRECLNPSNGRDITTSLLLDSILNVYKGHAIQTFNGVLDLAMKNCNPYAPKINVAWHMLLPNCQESGLVNKNFKGFIDCLYEGKLDEGKLNDRDELQLYVSKLLQTCNKNDQKIVLDRSSRLCAILLKPGMYKVLKADTIEFDIDEISLKTVADNIRNLFNSSASRVSTNSYRIDWRDLKMYDEFFIIEKRLIKPRICENIDLDIYQYDSYHGKYKKSKMQRLESKDDLESHVVNSLEKELNQKYNGDCFELHVDDITHWNKILNLYYYEVNALGSNFLYNYNPKTNNEICCPSLAESCDTATGLSFYECNKKHCFHNALHNQVIANEMDWHKYTFFHLVEIIGFPMMHQKGVEYEPDEEIRRFNGLVRKSIKKFDVTQCKSCGHLIFPNNSNSNNYSYFSCRNPDCSEYNKVYYISTCFRCRNLIDARESHKCPNGRYICPSCLSCCDDTQFEKEIQKNIRKYKSIPYNYQNLRGKGHNNRGIYFCPDCCVQVKEVIQEQKTMFLCPQCGKTYPANKL